MTTGYFSSPGSMLPLVVPMTMATAGRPTTAAAPGQETLAAVVKIAAEIPSAGRTAEALGTYREGCGVVIGDDGLILTVGYLIVEAKAVAVRARDDAMVPATVVGYDHESGFGLVRANKPLGVTPMELGDSDELMEREPVVLASAGGSAAATGAYVVSRREFAGYWEYLLAQALFTTPPHDNWAGAALIGRDGRLGGIGSLMVNNTLAEDRPLPGNMFMPINALAAIMGDLLKHGKPLRPQRPWLGLFAGESLGRLVVTHISPDSPAERAGVRDGDVILGVAGEPVITLAAFMRRLWSLGDAGIELTLMLLSETAVREVTVRTASRLDYLQIDRSGENPA